MMRLLLIAVVTALAAAKPDTYREKEDFKYSRSSSDEGSKSGFYGAQRGNMGGNFERAHNMDGLAQHQMSGLVTQVQGELGEGSKTRTGSVFTAASSKGIYGSGNYDLSNLEGRNFQEGVSLDDSQSVSALSSHAGYNVQSSASSNRQGYRATDSQSSSHHSGYNGFSSQSSKNSGHTYDTSDQSLGYSGQLGSLQELETARGVRGYDYGGLESRGHYSKSGFEQNAYDHTNVNSHSSSDQGVPQSRLIAAMPVRVVVRPGTKLPIPIATQTVHAENTGVAYDQNVRNSEAEILTNHNLEHVHKPAGQAKHYESAYSYHKEWEKHDTKPVVIPTENPFPKNSELYDDTQAHVSRQKYDSTAIDSQNSHSSNNYDGYIGYNTNGESSLSNRYQHQFNYNAGQNKAVPASRSNGNTYTGYNAGGLNTDVNNHIENADSKPKSYQSSFSYHKSWERQGDPYVIKPATNFNGAQESEKLTAVSGNQGAWQSQQLYGSQKNHQYNLNNEDCDCEEDSHRRVARSYNTNQHEQSVYSGTDDIGQLGQQVQNLNEQSHGWENLESLGQESQNQWDKVQNAEQETQNKWDKLGEDLGQQTQNQWNTFDKQAHVDIAEQQTQNKFDKLEDLGQQTQNQWNTFGEQTRPAEEMEQETQNFWNIQPHSAVQPDASQLTQNTWAAHSELPATHDVNQQTQNTFTAQPEISIIHNNNQQSHNTRMYPSEVVVMQAQNTPIGKSDNEIQDDENSQIIGDTIRPSNEDVTVHYILHNKNEFSKQDVSVTPSLEDDSNKKLLSVNKKIAEDMKPENSVTDDNFNNNNHLQSSAYNIVHNLNNNSHVHEPSNYNFDNTNLWGNEQQYTASAIDQQSQTYGSIDEHTQNGWVSQFNYKATENNINNQNTQNSPALSSLWNKIDSIEKQFSSNNESQYNFLDTQTYQNSSDLFANKFNRSTNIHYLDSYKTKKEASQPNINIAKILTTDIGRGDIGPEEQIGQMKTSTEKNPHETLNIRRPQDISQSNIGYTSQSVSFDENPEELSLDKPSKPYFKNFDDKNKHQNILQPPQVSGTQRPHGTLDTLRNDLEQQNTDLKLMNIYQQISDFEQKNTEQQFETLGHKELTPDEQNSEPQFNNINKQILAMEQHNAEQQFQIFQEQSQPKKKNKIAQLETFENKTTTLDEHNTEQEFKNIDQHNLAFEHQNTEQQFETFGHQKPTFTIEQENIKPQFENMNNQIPTFKQQNTGQQYQIFQEPMLTLDPKNSQQLEAIENERAVLNQQNTDQQFENLDQQSLMLKQQNTEQQFETYEQQNRTSTLLEQQNADQQFQIFQEQPLVQFNSQQLETFETQTPSLDQHNTDQQFDKFNEQSSKLEQQNTEQQFENFEQMSSNMELPKTEQHFEILSQTDSLEQHNMEHIEHFDTSNVNKEGQQIDQKLSSVGTSHNNNYQDQQLFNFGGPSNFNEPISGRESNYDGRSENQSQENTKQQFEHFDQFSEFSNQESVNKNFGTINEQDGNNEQSIQKNRISPVNAVDNLEVVPLDEQEHRMYIDKHNYSHKDSFKSEDISTSSTTVPLEVTTEKTGFWKNVGSKFVNAKDKVYSWFGRS